VHAMTPELSVCIVAYKTRDVLERCLRTVCESSGICAEVIVVDNASNDGTLEMLASRFPRVRVIPLDTNVGFGRAHHKAVAVSQGEILLILNPDTELRPHTLRNIVDFVRAHPEAGLVGGRALDEHGELEPTSCFDLPTWWSLLCFATGLSTVFAASPRFNPEALPRWDRDEPREVGMVSGAFVAMRRSVWDRLGGFDRRFFMYAEDADLSMRAHIAGYRPMITPDAEFMHSIGASSQPGPRRVMIMRGKATYARLHHGRTSGALAVRLLETGTALRATLSRVKAGVLRRPLSSEQRAWRYAWAHRGEWVAGYPPFEDQG